jgi:hypothetical protein
VTATAQTRSFFDVVVGEPLELAKSQPHQILLSTGSVALMGQFAGTSNIVHPFVGYCIAIGVEWAYLRGLASDSRAQTRWGGILNWSAFAIVVLWGVLWCAQQFGAFAETGGGWWLAAAHVVPVAWLSLCSAQCHRAATGQERKDERAADEKRRAWELSQEEEDRKLERWKEATRLRAELGALPAMPKSSGTVPVLKANTAFCKLCQKDVLWTTPSEAGTIKRWGCAECRARGKEQ